MKLLLLLSLTAVDLVFSKQATRSRWTRGMLNFFRAAEINHLSHDNHYEFVLNYKTVINKFYIKFT